jgi:hypothetical protein
MKSVLQYIVTLFGTMILVASLFVILFGIVNGFGTPDLEHKIVVTLIGVGALCSSIGAMYLVNDRDLQKMLDRVFDLVTFGTYWK